MSSPTSRSHASVSPDASQAHATAPGLVSLDTLVSHLLASKRSLSSISTVWRANEIVTSARTALEESVILSARTIFLRDGISEQVKILMKVRGGIEKVYKEGQKEFEVHNCGCAENRPKLIAAERYSNP
jgi:autophagy-related protein 17